MRRCLFPQLQLQWKNGQQEAKRLKGEAAAAMMVFHIPGGQFACCG